MQNMKSFRFSLLTADILRRIGLSKLYYWFNK